MRNNSFDTKACNPESGVRPIPPVSSKTTPPTSPPSRVITSPKGSSKASSGSSSSSSATGAVNKEKTICTVCEVESDNHHVHYGALACFSCRAFFRRAHNKGDGIPGYVCKKDGKCNVTAKNRKKCQRCRYDKCVDMGMNPSLVLTDDQKKVRFRKMLEKKGSLGFPRKRANNQPSSSDEDSGDEDEKGASGQEAREKKAYKEEKPTSSNIYQGYPFPDLGFVGASDFSAAGSSAGRLEPMTHFGKPDFCGTLGIHSRPPSLFSFYGSVSTNQNMCVNDFPSETEIKHETVSECINGWPQQHFPMAGDMGSPLLHHNQQPLQFNPPSQGNAISNLNFDTTMQSLRALLEVSTDTSAQQCNSANLLEPSPEALDTPNPAPMEHFHSNPESASEQRNPWSVNYEVFGTIVRSFATVMNFISLEADTQARFITLHYGDENAISMEDIKQVAACFKERFSQFAHHFPQFHNLPQDDQRQLLEHNSPLFVQYILARYFGSKTGSEQLSWLLGESIPDIMASIPLSKVSLASINKVIGLFQKRCDLSSYENLVEQLGSLGLGLIHNSIVAIVILFTQTEDMNLTEAIKVQEVLESMVDFASQAENLRAPLAPIPKEKLEKLIDILIVISKFYSKGTINNMPQTTSEQFNEMRSSNDGTNTTQVHLPIKTEDVYPTELEMPYTIEEEAWLKNQLHMFQAAYSEVSLGDDLVNEFVMFTYDVPLSKRFVPAELSTFMERTRRILKFHPEFECLTTTEQANLLKNNCNKVVALCSVKSESFPTGYQQLQFCFGNMDEANWSQRLAPLVQDQEMKKVLIADWNRTTKAMSSDELFYYLNSTGNLASNLEDCETFKILSLISLFSQDSFEAQNQTPNVKIRAVEKKYTTLLQRRAKDSYNQVKNCLENVNELANIFEKLRTF
ncbi:hypothetical protein TCAL_08790 [Tigriopus californicus]|uniref:Nuclear receptor domain-containing protein n=1 Tax=Tigriopus californicus TaxID=6832 RepID=A0A553PEZ8_TIGCA|nr:uncharacterized protein LOC131880589 [Tigriopus californicus]TRY76250.1 hypothetical protein TCAL_08790 [Tigriopus californicus]|eukprot:TCALIF_08790-PA protein Name:"Similar to nhr-7 Nuclear hormone receptor family member nhr-7 (Caenorhabditis elegans)" AED:0.44 eAED:0.44 QI:0/-1/0/1/-1/1/1/0/910